MILADVPRGRLAENPGFRRRPQGTSAQKVVLGEGALDAESYRKFSLYDADGGDAGADGVDAEDDGDGNDDDGAHVAA